LDNWSPSLPKLKGGGVWQDSPLSTGRRLVDSKFGNVADSLSFDVNGIGQAATIAESVKLLQLLQKAREFGTSGWQTDPVWIYRRLDCEENGQYGLIFNWDIPNLENPYAAPFYNSRQLSTMDNFTLGVEHSIWMGNQPGTGACVQASGVQAGWTYTGWETVDANPTYSLIQSTTGRIFAGQVAGVLQSDDDGATWAVSTAAPAAAILSMIQTSTGRILAAELGNVWRTDNDGVAWVAVAAPQPASPYVMIQSPTSGRLLMATNADVYYSDDNGENWASLAAGFGGTNYAMTQTPTGRILVGNDFGEIWYSDDDGVSWTLAATGFAANVVYSMLTLSDGRILAGSSAYTFIYISDDNGLTWSLLNPTYPDTNDVLTMIQASSGRVYAGVTTTDGVIYSDGLYDWAVFFSTPIEARAILETVAGTLLVGDSFAGGGAIYRLGVGSSTSIGQTATCNDQVFIANKQNVANLTNVYIDDGGAWSANLFPFAALPTALLPVAPAIGDALYLGIDTSVTNSGPFESLVFDLNPVISFVTSYTILWEYWDGAAWSTLTVTDGTNSGTGVFRTLGVSSVHWEPPTDWATRALNLDGGPAVTGYWVRARVSALVGAMTAPSQQNRNVYTVVLPYAEVAAAQVTGDIEALAQFKLHNRSDQDGGANPPELHDNRIFAGLRSYDRGPTFSAFLNASDEQNPTGVTVTVGANTIFAAGVTGITGRIAVYTGPGGSVWVDELTWTLGPTIARDYYGAFHAFLRVTPNPGSDPGDIHARLQVRTGSGGVTLTTSEDYFKGILGFEVLDLGRVTIPASGLLDFTDLGDSAQLVIQLMDVSVNGQTHLIHDLVLIPVDEWQVDAADYANVAASIIGHQSSTPHLLDIDSLIYQKADIRTLVRTADSNGFVSSIYLADSPGPAILQANARQRLWVFAMQTSATGTAYQWLAVPWVVHSIQIWANSRYLGFRGDR